MMEDSKSATLMMADWRKYIRNADSDIFKMIETAIMVAASHHPSEFSSRRQDILQTLFSTELIMRDNPHKQGEVLTMKENLDHKSGDESESPVPPMEKQLIVPTCKQQRPTTMIRLKLNREATKGSFTPEKKVNDHGARVYSQGVAEVLRMKKIFEKSGEEGESEMVMCDLLAKLQSMELSMKTLEVTTIGRTVSPLKKHASEKVRQIAVTLVKAWKRTVDEWLKKHESNVVEVEPNSTNVNKNIEKKLGVTEKAPNTTGNGVVVEKLEATKRKLQEGYEKAENMKKKRRIQVMDLHEVAKQGLLPQMRRCMKPCNKKLLMEHTRRNVYGRC